AHPHPHPFPPRRSSDLGTPMDTCFAYGQNPSVLRERYLEAHDLVVKAWTEPETFAWNGRFNQQRYVNIWPRPVQKPRPPIWIPRSEEHTSELQSLRHLV